MIITSNSVKHEITVPSLSIIGKVDNYQKVAYEATVYINSQLNFTHEYETTFTQYPQQIGVSTSLVEQIVYNPEAPNPGYATTIIDGVVYREATPQVAIGTVTYREVTNPIYDILEPVGIATTVTEEKLVSCFSSFVINFDISNIQDFTPWEDLTEEQVIGWVPQEVLTTKQQEHEATLEIEKDKVLDPLKYYRDTPPTPWRIRNDQQASINN
jgi:hypothetical protein